MFSGIVTDIGRVVSLEISQERAALCVQAALFSDSSIAIGDSIANSGVCLTVVKHDPARQQAEFDLATETLRCTTLGFLKTGSPVNLERSLQPQSRIDGHFVLGHVDEIARVVEVSQQENTYRVCIALSSALAPLVAPKGSICVDGVSLTVGEVEDDYFSVYLIPHTWQQTVAQNYQVGVQVNLEADCLARYVARILAVRGGLA